MSITNKNQSIRKGFSKVSNVKEWSVKDLTIYWKESEETSIKINELPFSFPDPVYPPDDDEKIWVKNFKYKSKHKHKLSRQERIDLIRDTYYFSPPSYFKIIKDVLNSREWTDSEKIYSLLYKLPYLCGNTYGSEIEKLLSNIRWKDQSFKIRMDKFYKSIRSYGFGKDDYMKKLVLDEKEVCKFRDKVILYRGFLVPSKESIRDERTSRWLKQATGQSVYFTTDINTAKYFAAINKFNAIMTTMYLDENKIIGINKTRLESKIAIAKYEVAIDDIILYDDYLGRKESECICLPEKVNLLHYDFMGLDDFKNALNAGHPSKKKT